MKALQLRRRAPGRNPVWTFFAWTMIRGALFLIFRLFYRLRCRGAGHVPPRGPIIYVANHQSHFDPVLVGILVHDRPFASMARASLFENPLFAAMIRSVGAVPLHRGRGDHGAFRDVLAELSAGRAVLVFPEGARTHDGAVGPFQRGILLLLRRSDAAVVPVAIDGAYDAWPRTRKLPKLRGRIRVTAGTPISAADRAGLAPDELLEMMRARVEEIRTG